MKIVLVTPTLEHGGGERFITELANYWSKIKHEVTIIMLRTEESVYAISDEVTLVKLGYARQVNPGKLKKLNNKKSTFLGLRRAIAEIQPQFVLSILSTTNVFTIAAATFLKTDVFVNDIMSPYRKRSNFECLMRKVFYRRAKGVVALTEIAKEMIHKETKSKNIAVIPNPVKKIILSDTIKREKMIINVGRLVTDKGHKYLIDAFADLDDPEWTLVILGEGYLRQQLEEQVESLGLSDRVLLPGATTEVDLWLNRASIFAFSSISESWGIALTEAMAAGLAVVSFDCDVGPRYIIRDQENGFLVPVRDVTAMTKKLAELIDNEALRIRLAKQAQVDADQYKIENVADRMLKFCTGNSEAVK